MRDWLARKKGLQQMTAYRELETDVIVPESFSNQTESFDRTL